MSDPHECTERNEYWWILLSIDEYTDDIDDNTSPNNPMQLFKASLAFGTISNMSKKKKSNIPDFFFPSAE